MASLLERGPSTATPPAASGPENASALTGARSELAGLNQQIVEASEALARCNAPVARLQGLISQADRADQDLAARRGRYDAELADWIANSCRRDRPPVPVELVAAEPGAWPNSLRDDPPFGETTVLFRQITALSY